MVCCRCCRLNHRIIDGNGLSFGCQRGFGGFGHCLRATGSTPAAVLTAALLSALGIWFVHAKTAVGKVETDSYQDLDTGKYAEILRYTGGNRYEVFYRGTHWQAQNTGQEVFEPGTRALIVRKEGNLLIIANP